MEKADTKYRQLSDYLLNEIKNGRIKAGDRLDPEKVLCEKFGFSRPTVRQAIAVLEQDGLVERRRGSGTYVKSQHPAEWSSKSTVIGVVIDYLDESVHPGIINGIESVLSENGYLMNLSISNDMIGLEYNALRSLLDSDVGGLIIEPAKSALPNMNKELYDTIKERRIPCVILHGAHHGMDFPCIGISDFDMGYAATQYLIDNGHTKIGGMFKSDNMQGYLRCSGYVSCLRDHRLRVSDENIMWYVSENFPHFQSEEGYRKVIYQKLRPTTGIVSHNDLVACLVREILEEQGHMIPRDYSLISFDNTNLAVSAGISSFQHPKQEFGAIAAKNLLKLIRDPSFHASVEFPPLLIERASVSNIAPKAD